jgi:hypothetical protein
VDYNNTVYIHLWWIGIATHCFLLFSFLTPHSGHERKAGHHFAGHDDWSRNKLRQGKRSFSSTKTQQFDHDDGQRMMPPQQ